MENPVDGVVDCARNGRPLAAAFFWNRRLHRREVPPKPTPLSVAASFFIGHRRSASLRSPPRKLLPRSSDWVFFLPDLTAGVDGITMRFQYEDSVRHRWRRRRRRRRRRCRTEFSGGFVCGSDDDGGDAGVWGGRSHKRERRKKRTEKRRKTNKKWRGDPGVVCRWLSGLKDRRSAAPFVPSRKSSKSRLDSAPFRLGPRNPGVFPPTDFCWWIPPPQKRKKDAGNRFFSFVTFARFYIWSGRWTESTDWLTDSFKRVDKTIEMYQPKLQSVGRKLHSRLERAMPCRVSDFFFKFCAGPDRHFIMRRHFLSQGHWTPRP